MKALGDALRLSASDLSNHLACRHLTALDVRVARGELERTFRHDAALEALIQRGHEHERAYIEHLRGQGLSITELDAADSGEAARDATLAAMSAGAEVIVQPTLATGRWFGRADVLRRVAVPSGLGGWSYEVLDTKLARETRAGTVLQLCLYSELLRELQGALPESMHVVTPATGFTPTTFRVADYMAYYRLVSQRLVDAVDAESLGETYPDPVPHCDICRWWPRCDARRREDDHLSYVAGLSTVQARELHDRDVRTLAVLAGEAVPLTWRPRRGSVAGLERVREQARVQLEARTTGKPVYELLPPEPDRGLARLPAPSPGDVFFDIEGDAFVGDHGLEYLFGWATLDDGEPIYRSRWAFTAQDERLLFESFVDEVVERWRKHPDLHVYHFAPYEPAALKRLMGRYAAREEEVDRMLRARLFVDLHSILKQSARASVERYGLKQLEPFFEFERELALEDARPNIHALEQALELGVIDAVPDTVRDAVEAYNRDDCISTLRLRDWLESRRAELVRGGEVIGRPQIGDGAPTEKQTERHLEVVSLMARLLEDVPDDPAARTAEQQARWLLAHMLEWHRREQKAPWWEYFRLLGLSDEDLIEERDALSGLVFECVVSPGDRKSLPVHRYRYAKQETSIRDGATLRIGEHEVLGTVVAIDLLARTIDVKKTRKTVDIHPASVFVHVLVQPKPKDQAVFALGEWVADHGIDAEGDFRAARDLLLHRTPRLRTAGAPKLRANGESSLDAAKRLALDLDCGVLPIQGPPGSGKTHTASRMISAAVREGKRVGVTAVSHKVIRDVLERVLQAADKEELRVQCVRKIGQNETPNATEPRIQEVRSNAEVDAAVTSRSCNVIGGTAWLWSRAEMEDAVDVLFVDEAGQMSLADTLACARGNRSLVLLGDPQQLEQPIQGSHPDGTAASALEHVLGGAATMPDDMGLFLDETWRLHPTLAAFTSELFYEGRLTSHPGRERQALVGDTPFAGAGLYYVPVDHVGNQSSSPEEVTVVADLVDALTARGIEWIDSDGKHCPITLDDILVVAPYNVQVADLVERLPSARIGTVDRFQGQEAPVVIYSLTSSSPEDAPRGMEFLYNLNRLNVATSRARCACILVGSPRLFEPECKSPRQMRLANALCRYLEMAKVFSGGLDSP